MSKPATTRIQFTEDSPRLYAALELSVSRWKIASLPGDGPPRLVTIPARSLTALFEEFSKALVRFDLSPETPIVTCYEAGRDGFWLHRSLESRGIESLVIDAGSIERPSGRRAKTDRLDALDLLMRLLDHRRGSRKVWSVVRAPSKESEEARRLHRSLERLIRDRTRVRNRAWADLALVGIRPSRLRSALRHPERLRTWDGKELGEEFEEALRRHGEQLMLLQSQAKALERRRHERLRAPRTLEEKRARQLMMLRGIGEVSAWALSLEYLGWRKFENRRQVAACAGLAGTPCQSGSMERDRGISKSGNRRVRRLMVQLAWMWLRHQPDSALTRWWNDRFASGGNRIRKVGITAVARKLLIALWRFLEFGEIPEGARLEAVKE